MLKHLLFIGCVVQQAAQGIPFEYYTDRSRASLTNEVTVTPSFKPSFQPSSSSLPPSNLRPSFQSLSPQPTSPLRPNSSLKSSVVSRIFSSFLGTESSFPQSKWAIAAFVGINFVLVVFVILLVRETIFLLRTRDGDDRFEEEDEDGYDTYSM